MNQRVFEKSGAKVSLLGFGCMRFPLDEQGRIDRDKSSEMLDYAYRNGVNYFDTAYPYHDKESELFVGEFLKRYPRESFYLATKLPCWEVKTLDDAKAMFENQLSRLQKDYVDFYMLHALSASSWATMRDLGVVEYLLSLKETGKLRHLGFSFHDEYAVFDDIVHYCDWDFCQLQLNYMDTREQAGIKGCELAKSLGIPVVVMEPIKGGSIANLPDDIVSVFSDLRPSDSAARWAMRWVGSLDNVKVILSGMSAMDQVVENCETFTDFEPLSEEEKNVVGRVEKMLHARINNGCTACGYCMPCPFGVDIPGNFKLWNDYAMYGNKGEVIWQWTKQFNPDAKAEKCAECGACMAVCPQSLSIIEDLKTLQSEFDQLVADSE